MTVPEIFSNIASHMIKGLMTHEQLANYFGFLGLKGYECCQEHQYFEESASYRCVSRYYLKHRNKLIEPTEVTNVSIIPDSWYKYTRQDVDISTKQTAIKNAFQLWAVWENDTKCLYEKAYKELLELNEIDLALIVADLIHDVSEELESVEQDILNLKSIDYDMSVIIPEQEELCMYYKQKLKGMNMFTY